MTTMIAPVESVKPSRSNSVISVGDVSYRVTPEASSTPRLDAWSLSPIEARDEPRVVVHQTHGGFTICSCRDWRFESSQTGGACQHTAALAQAGWIQPVPCPDCGHVHDQADPDAWPSPAPDDDGPVLTVPDDDGPRLTLEEALQEIKAGYQSLDTDLGDLLATTIGELLSEVRLTGARDVATLLDRRACLGS